MTNTSAEDGSNDSGGGEQLRAPIDMVGDGSEPADRADDDAVDGIDGRSLRRLRNRSKVVDAYLELVAAGNRSPSVDDLARYSGVSFRSIYRYFRSNEELIAAAARRGMELFVADMAVRDGRGDLEQRIDELVTHRLQLFRRAAPYISTTRGNQFDDADVAAEFRHIRELMARQIGHHFDPELGSLPSPERDARVAGLYLAFLHDSLRMLHDLYPDDQAMIREILRDHVRRHLV